MEYKIINNNNYCVKKCVNFSYFSFNNIEMINFETKNKIP